MRSESQLCQPMKVHMYTGLHNRRYRFSWSALYFYVSNASGSLGISRSNLMKWNV